MTHDLIVNILTGLNIKIESIEICDIRDNTFYAILNIKQARNKLVKIDSRPSDAIAIAVREKCGIFSTLDVLEKAGIKIQSIEEEIDKFKDFLEHVEPEDFDLKEK